MLMVYSRVTTSAMAERVFLPVVWTVLDILNGLTQNVGCRWRCGRLSKELGFSDVVFLVVEIQCGSLIVKQHL
jgi:hypothetical protein